MATWGCQDPGWARGRYPTAEEEEEEGKLAQTSDERQVRECVRLLHSANWKQFSLIILWAVTWTHWLFNDRIYAGFPVQCRLQSNKRLTTGEVQIKHKRDNVDFVLVKLCECKVFSHQAERQKLEPWAAVALCLCASVPWLRISAGGRSLRPRPPPCSHTGTGTHLRRDSQRSGVTFKRDDKTGKPQALQEDRMQDTGDISEVRRRQSRHAWRIDFHQTRDEPGRISPQPVLDWKCQHTLRTAPLNCEPWWQVHLRCKPTVDAVNFYLIYIQSNISNSLCAIIFPIMLCLKRPCWGEKSNNTQLWTLRRKQTLRQLESGLAAAHRRLV